MEQFGPRGGYSYREPAGKSPWEKDGPRKAFVVIGSSGEYELYNRWIVAVFDEASLAKEWCARCNEYAEFITRMENEAFEESARDNLKQDKWPQYEWAMKGSRAENKRWEEEMKAQGMGWGEICVLREKEIAWALNPLDPYVTDYNAMSLEYKVVTIPFNPTTPPKGV